MPAIEEQDSFERTPLTSKKFIAFMVSEVLWKAMAILIILFGGSFGIQGNLFTMVLIMGFVEVTYIGGQAALDHYVRTAHILAAKEKEIAIAKADKGVSFLDDLEEVE